MEICLCFFFGIKFGSIVGVIASRMSVKKIRYFGTLHWFECWRIEVFLFLSFVMFTLNFSSGKIRGR